MKIGDVRSEPQRRTFANAVTVLAVLALVSLLLELRSGSDKGEIAYSFGIFLFIFTVAALRFATRSRDSGYVDRLWTTGAWHGVVGLVAWLLPGRAAAPPATPSPAARPSSSRAVTLHKESGEHNGVRRGTYD